MKQILALWMARNREYYRDKGSLFWSFIATPLIVIILALVFSSENQKIFSVGVLDLQKNQSNTSKFSSGVSSTIFSDEPTIEIIEYSDTASAIEKIRLHQLDIFLSSNKNFRYWINPESEKGLLLEKILLAKSTLVNPQIIWKRKEIQGQKIRYIDWAIPGILAMNIMFSGLWGIGYIIVRYRKNGVLKRLKVTPLSAWKFLGSQALSRLCIMITVTSIVFFGCNLFIDFMMIGSYLLLLLVAISGNLAIISMSLLMAARTSSEDLANGLLNLISFPMLLLSELWFSLDGAPEWLQNFSQILPLTHLVSASRKVMLEGASLYEISSQLIILILMTGFFMGLAGILFRWDND